MLGPLLLNIYINDLFLFSGAFNIANYAGDCYTYMFSGSIDDVIYKLESHSRTRIERYEMAFDSKWTSMKIMIGNEIISNSAHEKRLGVTFDSKLTFNIHINKLCKKAEQKLHALARISRFMSIEQRKLIMNAFISSQFNYWPFNMDET